jgi:hypothetical protein
MTYQHPTYGEGEIISAHDGWIAVKFPQPPGLKLPGGIIPTLIIKIEKEETK